jgi:hypothetical protein
MMEDRKKSNEPKPIAELIKIALQQNTVKG